VSEVTWVTRPESVNPRKYEERIKGGQLIVRNQRIVGKGDLGSQRLREF
jgi:hypothetical protein